jgi:hypothetical protein
LEYYLNNLLEQSACHGQRAYLTYILSTFVNFPTDGQSVSQSALALSPSGTHDQIFAVVKTAVALLVVGRPPSRGDRSISKQVTVLVCVGNIYISALL